MEHYTLYVTPKAENDLAELRAAIKYKYKSPLTAQKYLDGLNGVFQYLTEYAEAFQKVPELFYEYDLVVRRINYKKMAIFYTIDNDIVYIQRVIPQSMVIY